jgi:hypothetical protein
MEGNQSVTGPAAINRLRALSQRLGAIHDMDAAWFESCLAQYIAGAEFGLRLDQAFGLDPSSPSDAWWAIEKRHARDKQIRAIRCAFYGDLRPRPAADAIAKQVVRYESGQWRSDRQYKLLPDLHGIRAELFKLLKIGAPVSVSTIRRALVHDPPLSMSQTVGEDAAATDEERYGSHVDEVETDPGSGRDSADAA